MKKKFRILSRRSSKSTICSRINNSVVLAASMKVVILRLGLRKFILLRIIRRYQILPKITVNRSRQTLHLFLTTKLPKAAVAYHLFFTSKQATTSVPPLCQSYPRTSRTWPISLIVTLSKENSIMMLLPLQSIYYVSYTSAFYYLSGSYTNDRLY